MVMIYRLTPIDPKHESWRRSKVTGQYVRVCAHSCTDARIKAATATDNPYADVRPPSSEPLHCRREKSPWELSTVTSCEEDPSEPGPPTPNDIQTQDGARIPIWKTGLP
jgi:hypothetical protein